MNRFQLFHICATSMCLKSAVSVVGSVGGIKKTVIGQVQSIERESGCGFKFNVAFEDGTKMFVDCVGR